MDPGEKDLPVMVNCLLTPDSKVQTLYLQYVKGKSAKEYIPITEAKVYVSSFFFTTTTKNYFHYVDGNRWESESFPVKGGRRYRLTVEIPGRDPIWAETTCPIAYRPALHTDLHEVHSMDYHSVYYQIEQFPTDKSHIKTSPVWVFAKGKLKTIEQCDENYPFIDYTDERTPAEPIPQTLDLKPYGIDLRAAWALGIRAWREPGLPGRYCPRSAAAALYRAILRGGVRHD
jgi:hypothetical protein